MRASSIGFSGVAVRFLFAFALVCLTWNPTRYNYAEWALAQWNPADRSDLWPVVAFTGIIMLMGWVFFLRTTARSLGAFGIVLCAGLAVTVFWALFKYNVVSTASTNVISWIGLALFSAVLAGGMSWAHLRARWSGQATVDDVER